MKANTCNLSLIVLVQLLPVNAFWRLACSVSQTARIDPILNPGTLSGHVHKFAGGNNVNADSSQDSLLTSTCSTCQVQSDKSAYWTPQLYYQHGNGSIEEVQNDGMTVYYVGRGGNTSDTQAFPPGFKMISGNSLLRHYDSSTLTYQDTRPVADRVSFRCINEANNIPETHYIESTNCVNGLRAQINFQSCWDGVNLYKPDQSHVAYLSGIDYGTCPPSHPVPIPGLFFEVLYWSNRIDQSDGGRFVFSNGDTTGYGFHGDFLNGWDQDVQQAAVQQCLYADNDGVVESCEPLQSSNDVNFSRTCPESTSVLEEAVRGVLSTNDLPGCNPITSGPVDVTQVICNVNSTVPINNSPVVANATSVAATVLPSPVLPGSFFTKSTTGPSSVTVPPSSTQSSSASRNVTLTTFTTIPRNSSITTSTALTGNKIVTITVPDFTTIAIEIPASLYPDTSYSDLAEATSYINALTSLASAQANNQTAPSSLTSSSIPDPESDQYIATVTELVTLTLPASASTNNDITPTISPGQFFTSSGSSANSSSMNSDGVMVTGTKTTFVTVFNPTVTLKVTSVAEVTVTSSPTRFMARGVEYLRTRKWWA